MARLLFAAHDPGGANLLLPVMAAARGGGHEVLPAPAGPATALWARAGETALDVEAADPDALLDRLMPDLVITGTGFGGYERHLWLSSRTRGIGSVATIDAWTNLRRRFLGPDGDDAQPDVLCLIDEAMRDEIRAGGWCRARLRVTGQPHLQATTGRLREVRKGRRPSARPLLAYFSEPVRQDHGGVETLGYDQVTAIDAIVAGLAGGPAVTLLVQPHPREDAADWRAWRVGQEEGDGLLILIGDGAADAVLAGCDAVLGMTTMVLVEAHLAGIPCLAVQPGRRRALNPLLDRIAAIGVVTEARDVAARLTQLLGELRRPVAPDPSLAGVLENADGRVIEVIHEELQKSCESA